MTPERARDITAYISLAGPLSRYVNEDYVEVVCQYGKSRSVTSEEVNEVLAMTVGEVFGYGYVDLVGNDGSMTIW